MGGGGEDGDGEDGDGADEGGGGEGCGGEGEGTGGGDGGNIWPTCTTRAGAFVGDSLSSRSTSLDPVGRKIQPWLDEGSASHRRTEFVTSTRFQPQMAHEEVSAVASLTLDGLHELLALKGRLLYVTVAACQPTWSSCISAGGPGRVVSTW